jgi:hypothetical protein
VKILSRDDLLENYGEILARGLSTAQLEEYQRSGNFGPGVIVQSSSGSGGGEILRIPRTPSDIADVFARTLVPYLKVFPRPPSRIAMLGGISHTEAAMKMDMGGIGFRSFSLSQLAELQEFDPEVISCYPHIARELYRNPALKFPGLKAFKLGGEPVLEADLSQLKARFPGIAIFEQVGSTEMPALAIGQREEGGARKLPLQKKRFEFAAGSSDQWRPLVAKDNFPGLLFPVREFYDTGDEAIYDDDFLFDVRRRGDPEHEFLPLLEELVREGATNAQLDRAEKCIFVQGAFAGERKSFRGVEYRVMNGALTKSARSNKLKFLRGK